MSFEAVKLSVNPGHQLGLGHQLEVSLSARSRLQHPDMTEKGISAA